MGAPQVPGSQGHMNEDKAHHLSSFISQVGTAGPCWHTFMYTVGGGDGFGGIIDLSDLPVLHNLYRYLSGAEGQMRQGDVRERRREGERPYNQVLYPVLP